VAGHQGEKSRYGSILASFGIEFFGESLKLGKR
jgi:hypothetical protein